MHFACPSPVDACWLRWAERMNIYIGFTFTVNLKCKSTKKLLCVSITKINKSTREKSEQKLFFLPEAWKAPFWFFFFAEKVHESFRWLRLWIWHEVNLHARSVIQNKKKSKIIQQVHTLFFIDSLIAIAASCELRKFSEFSTAQHHTCRLSSEITTCWTIKFRLSWYISISSCKGTKFFFCCFRSN